VHAGGRLSSIRSCWPEAIGAFGPAGEFVVCSLGSLLPGTVLKFSVRHYV
ncbi:MAG: hypothetical protein ACI9S9_004706, partial [Planctomycetota bacterium]